MIHQIYLLITFSLQFIFQIITLKNQEYQAQLQLLINNEWNDSKENIQDSLQKTLNELQSIQLQLQGEERKQQRDNLIQKHKELEQQLQQQMKNVNEIGDIFGITVNFIKDIKKELLIIQSKLDNIIDPFNQIGQDIKFLRGKTPQQLLEIRMEQVLQNKYIQDSQSVYVQIKVKEYKVDDSGKMKEEKETLLFNYGEHLAKLMNFQLKKMIKLLCQSMVLLDRQKHYCAKN